MRRCSSCAFCWLQARRSSARRSSNSPMSTPSMPRRGSPFCVNSAACACSKCSRSSAIPRARSSKPPCFRQMPPSRAMATTASRRSLAAASERSRSAGCVRCGMLRPQRGRRRHAGLQCAGRIGKLDLDPLVPRCIEPFAHLRATPVAHQRVIVRVQHGVVQHGGMEPALNALAVLGQVVEHLHVGMQAERRQQLERRGAQQLGEPCMEGANLDPAAGREHALVKSPEGRCQGVGLRLAETARTQFDCAFCIAAARCGVGRQPLVQPNPHLARGLAGERDREDLVRLAAVEQRTQDARHQHPGLARTGAGLDRDAATRIAGDGVERLARREPTVDAIRRTVRRVDAHPVASAVDHWSRRHNPRASQ